MPIPGPVGFVLQVRIDTAKICRPDRLLKDFPSSIPISSLSVIHHRVSSIIERHRTMRVAGPFVMVLVSLWCVCLCLWASSSEAAPGEGDGQRMTRERLVGTWRLTSIEYSGPHGETADPYYQPDSSGIIIYDASGWMSVQITAQNRRTWEIPEVRVPGRRGQDAALKAEAFDTYYSYYGTWDYDAATSVVTHHVKSSLIPAEAGMNYAQTATLQGGHLIFTVRSGSPGARTVRRKLWEKVATADNGRTKQDRK